MITGPTGVGKSYLAQALGHQTYLMGHKTFYRNSARLFSELRQGKTDGPYLKSLYRLLKATLLIIDDFG